MEPSNFSHLLHVLYGSVASGNWQPFLQQVMELTGSNKAFVSFRKANNALAGALLAISSAFQ